MKIATGIIAVAIAGIAFSAIFLTAFWDQLPSREPATCKEFVELLESRGMKIEWAGLSPDEIVIVRKGESADFQVTAHRYGVPMEGVKVRRYKTKKEAKDLVDGRVISGFAWGRFVIRGWDHELAKEIRDKL